jgi:hypothetical protein
MVNVRERVASIFISYRQEDAKGWAIALRDDLAAAFGPEHVFLDKDALHAGNWREQIDGALDSCKVMLIVIGPRWLTIADDQGRPRIQQADDVHHHEVSSVLQRPGITVIPVLVDNTLMPRPEQLPEDLRALCDRQARMIGDTAVRRTAELSVLVGDISAATGLAAKAPPANTRSVWRLLDLTTFGLAFVATVAAGMFAYEYNARLAPRELLFVLFLFAAIIVALRTFLRRRRREPR